MATEAHHPHAGPTGFIRKYIFSVDHKVIGIQYILLALAAVFVGMFLSLLMRLHLAWPTLHLPIVGLMTPEQYLALMTMHGTIMVFFVLTTAPQSGFGNYFLPIQIGAADMAFPVLNMLSFWLTFVSFLVMLAAFVVEGGAPISGWTGYVPLSALGEIAGPGLGWGQSLWVISLAIFCGASLMGALNFITTMLDLRTRGLSLMRLPLTCWAWFITAILALLGFAVLLAAGVLLLLDRHAGTSFFIPGGLVVSDRIINHKGGSPLLWQHLFWFFGHPEVYIAILPGMGIVSHVLSTFARKPIFGYRAMVYAMGAIALLGLGVWGHHMFQSGMSPYSAIAFSLLTMSIGVPSAIKTFNWIGTLWGARIRFTTAMLYALGFVSLFVSGGLSGIFLAQPSVDIPLHDTYFVVAHFHIIMGVAAIFGMFAGTYFWFPKMFGKHLNEGLGKLHFWLTFVGVYAIFMPMHYIGLAGNLRRYADTTAVRFLAELQPVHTFMSIAAFVTIGAQLIFLFNLIWSLWKGKKAESINPWDATTLEWTIPSPPPHDNFAGHEPTVYRGPYEFAVPGADKDFVPQHVPEGKPAAAHGDD
ncbi:MAG TPA: cbb3-type cytochrome c oxidase subunit I [Candidatus Acidoferrales bacterium]|nr:cbb3-type cytochrome c oxidase subunit I [Candidatus Acidoferrales bacterium]